MSESRNISAAAREYVTELLSEQLDPIYTYHNLAHTQGVVRAVVEIGRGNAVSADELQDLELAAWFHDTGYIDGYEEHEARSTELAEAFLTIHGYDVDRIARIKAAILDTRFPANPQTTLGCMLSDADMHHLGTDTYFEQSALLREEWEGMNQQQYTEKEWYSMGLKFMHMQEYHTEYSKQSFGPKKEANLRKMQKIVEDLQQDSNDQSQPPAHAQVGEPTPEERAEKKRKKKEKKQKKLMQIAMAVTKAKAKQKKKEKDLRPERGIETMFRVTLKNHIQLSQLADSKANIMLSINAIIISIVLSALLPRVDNNQYLLFPMMILLVVCVVSMGFATVSTIPQVTEGNATRADIIAKSANLLFFGNFHKMELNDYRWGMNQLMEDRDYLYNSMIKDLYFLGRVLHRKYHYLRITYTVFMIGLVISVLSFIFAYWWEFGFNRVEEPVAMLLPIS